MPVVTVGAAAGRAAPIAAQKNRVTNSVTCDKRFIPLFSRLISGRRRGLGEPAVAAVPRSIQYERYRSLLGRLMEYSGRYTRSRTPGRLTLISTFRRILSGSGLLVV